VHLDEEGGVMKGDEARWKKWLSAKLDVGVLHGEDIVCTWGAWQKEFYLSRNPACATNLFVTGHPRFDLYKPHLKSYYAADAKRLQERFGDFVLINTNFAWANNRNGITRPFSTRWNFDADGAVRFLDHVEEWGNNSLIATHFVKMTARLAVSRPDLQFVLRPHPSEHIGFYRAIFSGVKNVHVLHEGSVGAWLLACRALIHDGCTTGLEAHFAGTPVITYKPVVDGRFDLLLPNLFGAKCFDVADVLSALEQTQPREVVGIGESIGEGGSTPDAKALDENERRASELIANFEMDSFAALRRVIAKAVAEKRKNGGSKYNAGKYQSWENVRRKLRAARTMGGLRSRRAKDAGVPDKFFQFQNEDIENRLQRVQKITGVDLKHQLLSGEMMTIEK
jgi:surface carbohydrate biosynthesis protein